MTPFSRREIIPLSGYLADSNALVRYPAEKAAWIWHPDKAATETAVLRFQLRFRLESAAAPLLHVTADQRFQLRCDGRDVTFGPDRCDKEHWTFHSVRLDLAAGEHELEALVWFIGEPTVGSRRDGFAERPRSEVTPPMAQMSWRGGFLLYGEDIDSALVTTGEAPWMVDDVSPALEMARPAIPNYHDVGPCFTFDLARWAVRTARPAAVVAVPLVSNPHGIRRPGWNLFPAELPEQQREPWSGGRIRAFRPTWGNESFQAEETRRPEVAAWQQLIEKGAAIVVPAQSQWTILWDLQDYRCGYPITRMEGGEGALVEWSWAEALYEAGSSQEVIGSTSKGQRNEIEGKAFIGIEDAWRIGPQETTVTPSLWWRCGRYVRLRVATADRPLTLTGLGLLTTGYPLDRQGDWKSSDASWDGLMPLFERSYRIGAHETWTDTPYYEQMCYVGDNLFNALSNYAWFGDARLSRRSIELYEWSRHASGLVAERYPSNWRQESSTFSLYWPMMVRDYAWWREDDSFIKAMLPGLRSVLAEFEGMAHADGLLHRLPGWCFVDWVPEWGGVGYGPGVLEGDSSILNLQWVLSLLAAAQVEEAQGDSVLAQRNRHLARQVFDRALARYWDPQRSLFLDTHGASCASEHAQMFALLTGLLDAEKARGCLAAIKREDGLAKTTIGASFYLLDALYQHGEEAEFYRRLEFWRALPGMGFTATPEAPEPSRSDSHPWGAHPAWHTLASIAGVRPDAPGFARVKVAPLPGALDHFEAKVVHPRGAVEVAYHRSPERGTSFRVSLPEGISGQLVFQGQTSELRAGRNEIVV